MIALPVLSARFCIHDVSRIRPAEDAADEHECAVGRPLRAVRVGVLRQAPPAALEKAKAEKEADGKFESEHPVYCGAQDTFYVGNLKGAGRISEACFSCPEITVANRSSSRSTRQGDGPVRLHRHRRARHHDRG